MLTLRGHADDVTGIAFSPDGRRLATSSWDRTVKVWDALAGREAQTFRAHGKRVGCVAFSPNGQRIASGGDDGRVLVWEAATGRIVHTLEGHLGGVSAVTFSPDGQHIASAGADEHVCLWDAATGRVTLLGLASRSGPRTPPGGGQPAPADAATRFRVPPGPRGVAFSPDGQHLAAADADAVSIWYVGDARPAAGK
jgi:WD40 repeat protein